MEKSTKEGKVKVLDFGLAKAMDLPVRGGHVAVADDRDGRLHATRLTSSAPPEFFMSPEQARGSETDSPHGHMGLRLHPLRDADRTPGSSPARPSRMRSRAILNREPDSQVLPARTPTRLFGISSVRCLEKDAGRRLRDAGDARLELEAR